MCKGGTNVVDLDPDPEPEPLLDCLLSREVIDRIVLIDPVGDRVSDWSGMVIDRSSASLYPNNQSINIRTPPKKQPKEKTHQIALTHLTRSLALSAASLSTPSP